MVTVKNVHQRISQDGKTFVALELSGDLELVQSQRTGRFYATTKRCFIASTLSIWQAKLFIGQQIPGRIVRIPSAQYEYTVPETGEAIILCHSYEYQPEEVQDTKIAKPETMEGGHLVDKIMSHLGD